MTSLRSGLQVLGRVQSASFKNFGKIEYGGRGNLFNRSTSVNKVQIATLKATYGEKYPYSDPYPYKLKKYGPFNSIYDKTLKRFNENTKIIAIEGNMAVGKAEFGRALARRFDLVPFEPTASEKICFYNHYNYDLRKFNELLPPGARYHDIGYFFGEERNPGNGKIGLHMLDWYQMKVRDYLAVMKHLLNTGQGAVMVTSAFSDEVYIEAMYRMGWLSSNFMDYYKFYKANSICECQRPHLTIYLDAPVSKIRERIVARNNENEVKSGHLTDKYLETIEEVYKEKFLPESRKFGEVVEIDWTEIANEQDIDVIAEELQLLKLETVDLDDVKFRDWNRMDDEDYLKSRLFLENEGMIKSLFELSYPFDCQELITSPDDALAHERLTLEHPFFFRAKGWAPEFGHKVMFK